MIRHILFSALLPAWCTAAVAGANPLLFFGRGDLPALRARAESAPYAALWQEILRRAEGYCDPASPTYADPADPFPPVRKRERMRSSRHDALQVHRIGRDLTKWMETIGFAYQLTGRKEFGAHGAKLLLTVADEYPVARPEVAKGFAGGRGDIMQGLAVGYDLLAEVLEPAQRQVLAAACAAYIEHFRKEFESPKVWWYRVHNYNGVNGGAAGCLALALREAYPDKVEEWTRHCVKIIQRWLDAGFDEGGAYYEGIGYSEYGLGNTVRFGDALRRNGGPDLFAHPTFRRFPVFYALSLLPGERVYDARNDSNYAGARISLLKLAEVLDNGLCRWLWDRTGADKTFLKMVWHNEIPPVDPVAAGVPLARHFRGRGLCVWRTGWGKGDTMFSIEAGPYQPTTHNQADKGHFTLYGLGYRWAVDAGYANEHEPKGRGQTLAHSCVLVDEQGQARSGAGWGTNGAILDYENTDRYGYALADCTEAYNRNNKGIAGVGVLRARRHTMFFYPFRGAPAYAVVLDDIRKDDQPHEYTWQMMFAKGMDVAVEGGQALFTPFAASGDAYLRTPFTATPAPLGARGKAVFRLEIREAGRYLLWARVRTLAEQKAKSDSFFVRMDAGRQTDWHMPASRSWTWGKVSAGPKHDPLFYDLEVGQHSLTLAAREPGAEMDCLFLTRDPKALPTLPPDRESGVFLEAEDGQSSAPMTRAETVGPGARLRLRLHAQAPIRSETDVFTPEDWVGPATFRRFRAHVRTTDPRYMAVLLPLPEGMAEPAVSFRATPEGRRIEVSWPEHTDTIVWPDADPRKPYMR